MDYSEDALDYIDALTPNYYNSKLQIDLKNDKNNIFNYIGKIFDFFLYLNINEYYINNRGGLTLPELYINNIIEKANDILINEYTEFIFFDNNFDMIMETIDKKNYQGFINNKGIAYKVLYYLIYLAIYGQLVEKSYLIDYLNDLISSDIVYEEYYKTNTFPMEKILIDYSKQMLDEYINIFVENKVNDLSKINHIYERYKNNNTLFDNYSKFDKIITYYNNNIDAVFEFIKTELNVIKNIEDEPNLDYKNKINEYNNIFTNKVKNFLSPLESFYYKFLNYSDDQGYIFNPSILYMGNNKYISIFRNTNMVLPIQKLKYKLNPKGSYNCNNYPKSDLRNKNESFMWGNWGVGTILFDDDYILAIHDDDFVIDLDKTIDLGYMQSNDRRLIKFNLNEYYNILFDFNNAAMSDIDDLLDDNHIILSYDSNLNNIDILTKTKTVKLIDNLELKGKNYGYIDIHDNKLIFTDWFYKDGLKILKIDNNKKIEQINVLSPIKIFGSSSMTDEKNMPEFSFSTPNLKIDKNTYIGIGHIKIKNYSNNYDKNILYSRTLTNLYRYLKCVNSCEYIRHSANVLNCVGYQYYIFFYIFKINDDFTKMEYFKISDSFIPIINDKNQFFENYEYSLVFPNGIDYNKDEDVVIISLGEGDIRSAILKYKLDDILKCCIHDITNIKMDDYNIYPIIY